MNMPNLKPWQESAVVLILTYIIVYLLGRQVVPLEALDQDPLYLWPPLIYTLFLMLPLLVIRHSRFVALRICAGIVLCLFLLAVFVPLLFTWHELYGNAVLMTGNPFLAIFTVLYTAPLSSGIVVLMVLLGGSM